MSMTRLTLLLAATLLANAAELRIGNRVLDVAVEGGAGALRFTDKRIGRAWTQKPFDDRIALRKARVENGRIVLDLIDSKRKMSLTATVALEGDAPEAEVTIAAGEGKLDMWSGIAWPHPIATEKGTSLVVPENEGMLYPVDDESVPELRLWTFGGHGGVSMPWFGVTDMASGAGIMAIIATPDDACIYISRTPDKLLVARPEWLGSRQQFRYARRIVYSVLARGGYVAQAKRYREYAVKTKLFKSLVEKKAENPNVDLLIGAVNVWNWDMDKTALCREMKSLGMERVLWSNGGQPKQIAEIDKLGYLTSKYENLGDIWPPRGPKKSHSSGWPDDLVWSPDGKPKQGWINYETQPDGTKKANPGGNANSQASLERVRLRIPKELETVPLKCRFEDTTTATPFWEDYNPAHPASRSDDRRYKMAMLEFLSHDMKLVVGSETGLDCAVPYLHYFEGMLSIVKYRLPDSGRDMLLYKPPTPLFTRFLIGPGYRIPLFELVYHDAIVSHWYWGDYNNKVPEVWDTRDLWNMLYGTPPMFMFTKETWEARKPRFVQCYKSAAAFARQVGYDEMLSHEFLTPDHTVQRVRWSSGVEMTVNFGASAYTQGSETIAPFSRRERRFR
jgi:hypothetical protein